MDAQRWWSSRRISDRRRKEMWVGVFVGVERETEKLNNPKGLLYVVFIWVWVQTFRGV